MSDNSFPKATDRKDKVRSHFSGWDCHLTAIQECARQRPWCARMASEPRHHKIRVGDLCLAVQGSHRASPGEPAGDLQARRTVPTRTGARERKPRVGKRVNRRYRSTAHDKKGSFWRRTDRQTLFQFRAGNLKSGPPELALSDHLDRDRDGDRRSRPSVGAV